MKYPLKTLTVWAILAVILSISPASASQTPTFTTGKDWTEGRMSTQEKLISVAAPFIMLERYGVPFQKTPDQYVQDVDRVLLYNPYLGNEDIANIFASTVYSFEPGSRPALDELDRELHFRQNVSFRPRLRVDRDTSQL